MPSSHDSARARRNSGLVPIAERAYDSSSVDGFECEGLLLDDAAAAGARAFRWRVVVAGEPFVEPPGPLFATAPRGHGFARTAPDEELLRAEWDGRVLRIGAAFREALSFYGGGEAAGPLLRDDRALRMWNTDAWCYGEETEALYQSHPFVLGLRPDGRAVGLFAATARRGQVEVAPDGVEFAFEGGGYELFVFQGDHPRDVLAAYTALIGRAPAPPRWALGYHQCRWSYGSEAEVRALVDEFQARDLPLAAVWLDIDHMDRQRVFTWDREAFPDPRGLVEDLQARGVRVVAIVDPGVVTDEADATFAALVAGDHAVRLSDGDLARGRVWPGVCAFPDFTRPETRAWWAERVQAHLAAVPLDGIWCDMNEPACMRVASGTLPDDARHAGGTEDETLGEWPAGDHARWHNLYGHGMAAATRTGVVAALRARGSGDEPFVLTRAAFASTSRFAATWTGDNQARWEDLAWSIPMTLNLGLSGQPFAGPDVGGFFGDPEPELFARWFEACVLLPFFRGHSEKTSCRKEPWSFGPAIEARIRGALATRERFRPELEAAFAASARTGSPPVRPVWWLDPADARLRAVDDAYLVGDTLLVAPFVTAGEVARTVALPRGRWTRAWTDGPPIEEPQVTVHSDETRIPVFRRAP